MSEDGKKSIYVFRVNKNYRTSSIPSYRKIYLTYLVKLMGVKNDPKASLDKVKSTTYNLFKKSMENEILWIKIISTAKEA